MLWYSVDTQLMVEKREGRTSSDGQQGLGELRKENLPARPYRYYRCKGMGATATAMAIVLRVDGGWLGDEAAKLSRPKK
jgi:hypothetical protein